MGKYFDWNTVFTRDKHINVVVGARGIGKTFGMRLQLINDYIKKGKRCIEIVRYKDDMKYLVENYHERIADFFPDFEFDARGEGLYIRRKTAGKAKVPWEQYGYVAALSMSHKTKRKTYKDVHRIIFDEFALNRRNVYERYLKDEVDSLSRVVSTASRERADGTGGDAPYIYLIGNATDRFNPYYEHWGFDADKLGITIKDGRLFYNVEQEEDIYRGTVAHNIAGETLETRMASGNAHDTLNDMCRLSKKKPAGAVPLLGIKWREKYFTLWRGKIDWHVEQKRPPEGVKTVATRLRDGAVNVQGGKWLRKNLRPLSEMYALGMCTFDTPNTFNEYLELMEWIEV